MLDLSIISEAELLAKIQKLSTLIEVAHLLGVSENSLRLQTHYFPERYREFEVPKKAGGSRWISAPNKRLKLIQSNLAQVLSAIYNPSIAVQGYVKGRSIVSNARIHQGQPYIINLDLKDFFPSITIARVIGLFQSLPFNIPYSGARILAHICCDNQILPQGAPTSPVIANLICRRLDREILSFSEERGSVYSRYADDITISTKFNSMVPYILSFDDDSVKVKLDDELQQIIDRNGFTVNYNKVRLQTYFTRQEVTGIIVNKRLNVTRETIRQVRAMTHALRKFGPILAQEHFYQYYDNKKRENSIDAPEFLMILRGKIEFIGMIRGKNDALYRKLLRKFIMARVAHLNLRKT